MSKRIEGGERLTLHLNFAESALFSEAYFVLRRPKTKSGEPLGDIVAEARRIIREYSERMTPSAAPGRKRDSRTFLSGAFAGVAASAAVVFVFALLCG